MHQDLLTPKCFGHFQSFHRLLGQPSLQAEDHDLMEPHAGGIESGLKVALRGRRWLRALAGSDSPGAIGEELKLARRAVVHGRPLIEFKHHRLGFSCITECVQHVPKLGKRRPRPRFNEDGEEAQPAGPRVTRAGSWSG
jgi:hypothetical protein